MPFIPYKDLGRQVATRWGVNSNDATATLKQANESASLIYLLSAIHAQNERRESQLEEISGLLAQIGDKLDAAAKRERRRRDPVADGMLRAVTPPKRKRRRVTIADINSIPGRAGTMLGKLLGRPLDSITAETLGRIPGVGPTITATLLAWKDEQLAEHERTSNGKGSESGLSVPGLPPTV